jgi:hypothetical protein
MEGLGSAFRHARAGGHPGLIHEQAGINIKTFLDSRFRGNDKFEMKKIPDF